MKETWKPVPGYEGLYEVSDLGNVRGRRNSILKPRKTKKGYLIVALCKDRKPTDYYIHRLVYNAFNGEISTELEVNHINRDRADNRLINLNLMSHNENIQYSVRKAVIAYDKAGNFVKEFNSLTEAEKWLEKPKAHTHICSCLKGKRRSAYGYIWKYKN